MRFFLKRRDGRLIAYEVNISGAKGKIIGVSGLQLSCDVQALQAKN